ncbi:MAG: transcriptional regulator [Bacteroidetes bacterium]|nr:transcriptional regulator [Bacteroidota bacterium]MCK6609991.1 transcriptional regulator [Bacteroidia bacterium]
MNLVPFKLLTIVATDAIEHRITKDLKSLGAKGYTRSEVEGEGIHGKHFSDWEGRNIKIETLVKEEVAIQIMEKLSSDYFGKYSIICFLSTVEVLRPERFA